MTDTGHEIGDHSYSEDSPFVHLLGKPGRTKILDVFLRRHYDEMTVSEVIEFADISRSTFHRNISYLEQLGIIEKASRVGNTVTYRLNTDNELTKTLGKVHADILRHTTFILDHTNLIVQEDLYEALLEDLSETTDAEDDHANSEEDVSKRIAESVLG